MWQYLVKLKHSVSFKENLLFCGNLHQINEASYSWIGVLTFLCNFMTGTEISWTFSVSTIEVTEFFRHIQIPWGMRFVLFLLFFLHYSLIFHTRIICFLKFFYCLQLRATWLCYCCLWLQFLILFLGIRGHINDYMNPSVCQWSSRRFFKVYSFLRMTFSTASALEGRENGTVKSVVKVLFDSSLRL